MPSAKKYKLVSAKFASETGSKPVCAFQSTPGGCRNGDTCPFLHTTDAATPTQHSGSSFVSSESEGEIDDGKSLRSTYMQEEQNQIVPEKEQIGVADTSARKKKKKKRKHENIDFDDDEIFRKPKKSRKDKKSEPDGTKSQKQRAFSDPPSSSTNSSKKKKKVNVKENPNHATTITPVVPATPVPGFASLKLPISPYIETPSKKDVDAKQKEESVETKSPVGDSSVAESKKSYPLPTSTSSGRIWQKVVMATQKNRKFKTSHSFEKYKKSDEESGLPDPWIKTKPFGSWCSSNPQVIAIDCEMCETRNPLNGEKDHKALCRISVVNAEEGSNGEVLLDTLVKPSWPVTDHRAFINGITKQHLENVEFTLRHAQAFMMALCSEETVILGHSVYNDLAAMRIEHYCVGDSAFLFEAKDDEHVTVSLKDLAQNILKKEMPNTHDSVNDALTTLYCLEHYLKKDGKVEKIERSITKYKEESMRLFVHRIPKGCQPSHLSKMFLEHTTIEPDGVDDITFDEKNFGKTIVTFRSPAHANLAFDTLEESPENDPSGRSQKKVYLVKGNYIRVRKMAFPRKREYGSSNSNRRGKNYRKS